MHVTRREVIFGTRASKLARRQTELMAAALRSVAPSTRLSVKTIATSGDRDQDTPLAEFGGAGLFVKELEQALLAGAVDIAVHSMKDLPSAATPGLCVAAVPPREDPRDALVSRGGAQLDRLPQRACVGTSSPRRRAQVLHHRPDLDVSNLRGNLDTRLRRLDEGTFQAILLAAAGLRRLGLAQRITQYIPLHVMLPAAGQGALALQTRADDVGLRELLKPLDDPHTHTAVRAEQAFLRCVGGGCHVPVGAHAAVNGSRVTLTACIAAPDGRARLQDRLTGAAGEAEGVGRLLADALLSRGGEGMLYATEKECAG
jgi:hydroxymethylbilane synthase